MPSQTSENAHASASGTPILSITAASRSRRACCSAFRRGGQSLMTSSWYTPGLDLAQAPRHLAHDILLGWRDGRPLAAALANVSLLTSVEGVHRPLPALDVVDR